MSCGAAAGVCALTWRSDSVGLQIFDAEGRPADGPSPALDLAVSPDDRYDLALRLGEQGSGWVRVPSGPRALFARVEPECRRLSPVPAVPGGKPLASAQGRIHTRAGVSVIEGERLHLFGDNGPWRTRELPRDIRAQDCSFNPAGGLWVAGAVPSSRVPGADSEIAVRYQAEEGAPFEARTPHLGMLAAAKVIRQGGWESLQAIDAETEPVAAMSLCPWSFDDASSFVFVKDGRGRWAVNHLDGRYVRRMLRPDSHSLLAVTAEGDIFAVPADGGTRLVSKATSLRDLLLADESPACPGARLVVRGADARGSILVVAAGLYERIGGRLYWSSTAVCRSTNAGATWTLIARTSPAAGDAEFVDVALSH